MTPLFERQQAVNAKLLVLAMVPPFALALRLLLPLRRNQGAIHVVFSLHFYSFLMACLTVLLPMTGLALLLAREHAVRISQHFLDNLFSSLALGLIVFYLWESTGRVYSLTPLRRLGSVVLLAAAVFPILQGYRLFLYWVTLKEI